MTEAEITTNNKIMNHNEMVNNFTKTRILNKVIKIILENPKEFYYFEHLIKGTKELRLEEYNNLYIEYFVKLHVDAAIEYLNYFWWTIPIELLGVLEDCTVKNILISLQNASPVSTKINEICKNYLTDLNKYNNDNSKT